MLFVACTQKQEIKQKKERVQKKTPNVITIETRDFTFVNVPDTIPTGFTTFRVENEGIFPHNAELVYLKNGHTYQEFLKNIKAAPGFLPSWAEHMGGPSAPVSGESSEATLNLKSGNYALVCPFPDKDSGNPHFVHGMARQFSVE